RDSLIELFALLLGTHGHQFVVLLLELLGHHGHDDGHASLKEGLPLFGRHPFHLLAESLPLGAPLTFGGRPCLADAPTFFCNSATWGSLLYLLLPNQPSAQPVASVTASKSPSPIAHFLFIARHPSLTRRRPARRHGRQDRRSYAHRPERAPHETSHSRT